MSTRRDMRPLLPTVPKQPSSPEQPKQQPPQGTAQHIPTVTFRPVPVTRELVDFIIQAARQHDAYLIGYGGIQAHAAF